MATTIGRRTLNPLQQRMVFVIIRLLQDFCLLCLLKGCSEADTEAPYPPRGELVARPKSRGRAEKNEKKQDKARTRRETQRVGGHGRAPQECANAFLLVCRTLNRLSLHIKRTFTRDSFPSRVNSFRFHRTFTEPSRFSTLETRRMMTPHIRPVKMFDPLV